MKLVVLMSVEEYVKDIRKLLKEVDVDGFSESEMLGYKKENPDESNNWFADKHLLESSHIFFTVCNEQKAFELLKKVENFQTENSDSKIHAMQLAVEKYIG